MDVISLQGLTCFVYIFLPGYLGTPSWHVGEYCNSIPVFLQDQPKVIVTDLLNKMQKVTTPMMDSIRNISSNQFFVKSSTVGTSEEKDFVVDFGNEDKFCSCTCPDFRRNRMICKHFFAVIERGLRAYEDITPLFRNHPSLLAEFEKNEAVNVDYGMKTLLSSRPYVSYIGM